MNDIRIAEEYFTGWDWARIVAILEEYDDGTAMVVRIAPKYLSKPYKVNMYQLTIKTDQDYVEGYKTRHSIEINRALDLLNGEVI
jgi:hypothetical protein